MFPLKQITPEAIPRALAKAERYRLLNEPEEAESICLDILAIDADNQAAAITLLLSLTDQFRGGRPECFAEAQAVVPRLHGEYERLYYSGIIWERRGTARLDRGGVGSAQVVFPWLQHGNGMLRQGRGNSTARQRRRHPALEHLCATVCLASTPTRVASPDQAGPGRLGTNHVGLLPLWTLARRRRGCYCSRHGRADRSARVLAAASTR